MAHPRPLPHSSTRHQDFTPQERDEFHAIFKLVDRDGGGTIDIEEMEMLLNTIGLFPTQSELERMFSDVDVDGSGEIDFEEFLAVMSRKVEASFTPSELKKSFRVFETPDMPPGYVRTDKLREALRLYSGEKDITEDRISQLLRTVDPENSGRVNYLECVQLLSK